MIKDAYEEKNEILGYRQVKIKLNREHNLNVNHKQIYRLMHILNLKSVCRRRRKNYIKSTPEITAENVLNRKFESNEFGTKWLTDVTEMKYSLQSKAYLSAILDLADKRLLQQPSISEEIELYDTVAIQAISSKFSSIKMTPTIIK